MKYRALDAILCPICKIPLNCTVFKSHMTPGGHVSGSIICTHYCGMNSLSLEQHFDPAKINCRECLNNEIDHGLLKCSCGHWYPIIDGIPRILPKMLLQAQLRKHDDYLRQYSASLPENLSIVPEDDSAVSVKRATMDKFGYEWTKFADYSADNFDEFIHPLEPDFFKGKTGLDVGCGAGRHMLRANKLGMEMFGIDLSEAVDSAYAQNKDNPTVHVIQCDIYNLPFRESYFDFVYSLGVLHHLPHPEEGFRKLPGLIKPGGSILIWLYKWSIRKVILEIFRKKTTKLPQPVLYWLAFLGALIDYGILVNLYKLLSRVPLIKGMVASITPDRIVDYARYDFRINHTDWYDRLSAPISNFYNEDDVEKKWFSGLPLKNIEINSVQSFWVRGFGIKE